LLKEHPETFAALDAALLKKLNIGNSVAPVVSEPTPSAPADPKHVLSVLTRGLAAKPTTKVEEAQETMSFAEAEPVLV
jgi:hypothetical protein